MVEQQQKQNPDVLNTSSEKKRRATSTEERLCLPVKRQRTESIASSSAISCMFCYDDPTSPISIKTVGAPTIYCVECLLYHIESQENPEDPLTRVAFSVEQLERIRHCAQQAGIRVTPLIQLKARHEVDTAYREVELLCRYNNLSEMLSIVKRKRNQMQKYLDQEFSVPLEERVSTAVKLAQQNATFLHAEASSYIDWSDEDESGEAQRMV
jgi:hypothetical protein